MASADPHASTGDGGADVEMPQQALLHAFAPWVRELESLASHATTTHALP